MQKRTSIQNVKSSLHSMLPYFGKKGNFRLGNKLPDSFRLDVPYVKQEQFHSCGAACARMILAYFKRNDISEEKILSDIGCTDFENIEHGTYAEVIGQWLLTHGNLLPASYSPAGHINPIIKDGIVATDFIRTNYHEISEHDFELFRNILVETKSPCIVRIHFTTDTYPMTEEVARVMDGSGHALLMIGYDDEGFIFNDPWDLERWGGERGGQNVKILYEDLRKGHHILVNCSLEQIEPITQIVAYFEHLPVATCMNRDVTLELVVRWKGIENVFLDRWKIKHIKLDLHSHGTLKFPASVFEYDVDLLPGNEVRLNIPMNTGEHLGSSQISFDLTAQVVSPPFPWIKSNTSTNDQIKMNVKYRVSVQSDDFFKLYGMLDKS